jgi:two-component system, NarL family, nitrate/nitrite response regulator NarL
VVGVATTGQDALVFARQDPPDVWVIDIGLPDQSGLVVGRLIRELLPGARILALSALDDPRLAQEAARVGFSAYLTKDVPISEVLEALKGALDGGPAAPYRTARRGRESPIDLVARQLTDREREVLALLVEGLPGEAIARRLGVSRNTVRTHVQNILSKLQVHSRLEAATLAVRHRLLEVGGSRRA